MIQWTAIKALFMNKWVLIGGSILLALVIQQGRIWAKDRKIDKQDLAIAQYKNELALVIDANESQHKTISRLREANEQCALDKAVNEENSKLIIASQNGRISSIRQKYEQLKNIEIEGLCTNYTMHPDVYNLVQKARGGQD